MAVGRDTDIQTPNGYRPRDFDTRAGPRDLAIPRLRLWSYFPAWLRDVRATAPIEPLTSVVATCCLLGVSARWTAGAAAGHRYPTSEAGRAATGRWASRQDR